MRWRCRQPCDGGATGTAVAGMALSLCIRHFIMMRCNLVVDGVPTRPTVRDLVSARERRSLASNQMVSRRDYTPSGGARPIHGRYGSASHRPFDTNLDG